MPLETHGPSSESQWPLSQGNAQFSHARLYMGAKSEHLFFSLWQGLSQDPLEAQNKKGMNSLGPEFIATVELQAQKELGM